MKQTLSERRSDSPRRIGRSMPLVSLAPLIATLPSSQRRHGFLARRRPPDRFLTRKQSAHLPSDCPSLAPFSDALCLSTPPAGQRVGWRLLRHLGLRRRASPLPPRPIFLLRHVTPPLRSPVTLRLPSPPPGLHRHRARQVRGLPARPPARPVRRLPHCWVLPALLPRPGGHQPGYNWVPAPSIRGYTREV